MQLCGMCLVRSRERKVRWSLEICLRECFFHQSTSERDGSMVLMLPLTHGSGNVAKTYPSLSDIPQLLDLEGRCKLGLLSRHLKRGLWLQIHFKKAVCRVTGCNFSSKCCCYLLSKYFLHSMQQFYFH